MGTFRFKQFEVDDSGCGMKIGTDSVLLGAWADVANVRRIVDAGAGSALLALMMAQRTGPETEILAVEVDEDACRCAEVNISRSPWQSRLTVVCADLLTYRPGTAPDLIISNPPYFTNGLLSPDSQRAMARHCGGEFSPMTLLAYAADILADEGSLAMVTPADYADRVIFEAEMHRLRLWRQCLVSTVAGKSPSRILWQFARTQKPVEYTMLTIRDRETNQYTLECKNLTQEFYL